MSAGSQQVDPPISPGDPEQMRLGQALFVLLVVPVVASVILLGTLAVVKDEDVAVAVPIGGAIGFVVIVASSVTLWTIAHAIRPPSLRRRADDEAARAQDGLSVWQAGSLLLSFVILTAVPAGVVVGATALLRRQENLFPEFALPVILIVGLIGLLAVLALMVAVFRRFHLVSAQFPLGLPEGSIQAVIALSLILIFAIIGVYLHATATGEQKEELSTQLLTTVSTLVVAVAGFYFGSKTTKEAAEAAVRGRGDGGTTPTAPGEQPPEPEGEKPPALEDKEPRTPQRGVSDRLP